MNAAFYTANRARLAESVNGGVIVLAANTALQRRGDASFPFEQEANFLYLSGISYPDWRLVIDGSAGKSWLIAPAVDAVHQLFDGSLNSESARKISGVDEVVSSKEGNELLRSLATRQSEAYTLGVPAYARYASFSFNPAQAKLRRELKRLFGSVHDCTRPIAKLRAIKQPEEIAAMKEAADTSVQAFNNVKADLSNYRYEYEVEAELTHQFRRHNLQHAFDPIVAASKNACTLHYTKNDGRLTNGMLLIDAGASKDSYPADITRTFTLGEVSKREKTIHAAVRDAEAEIIGLLKPGLATADYIEASDQIMKHALMELGLMKSIDDAASFRRYFPHAVSHGLGIEVHESLGGFGALEPGMVLTVEPGIYVPEEGIGVRIEDDILITPDGNLNLTARLSTEL